MIVQKKRWPWSVRIAVIAGSIVVGVLAGYRLVRPWWLDRAAEKVLRETPAFQEIARWEPGVYKQMKAGAVEAIRRGNPPDGIQASIRRQLLPVVKTYLPRASDEALIEYLRVSLDEAEQIAAKNPDAAYAMLISRETVFDLANYVDATTLQRDARALAEIVRTGVANDAGYQNDRHAQHELDLVKQKFVQDYGADGELVFTGGRRKKIVMLAPRPQAFGRPQPENPKANQMEMLSQTVEKPRTVEMAILFHRRILELRTDVAAQVVRLMLSKEG